MKPPRQEQDASRTDVAIQLDRPPSVPWWPLVGLATLVAAAATLGTWNLATADNPARAWTAGRIAAWYGWALLAPLVAMLSYRLIARHARLHVAAAAHLALLVACTTWHAALVATTVWTARHPPAPAWSDTVGEVAGRDVEMSLLSYAALAGSSYAAIYRRRLATSRAHTRDLERALIQARLLTLQRQLQPHFLFNALHAISSLMYRDVPAAEQALVTLGDLLRMTLERSGDQHVPLADELRVVSAYLRIEQLRMQDPLAIRIDVEPGAEHALVPNLLLQPLVENAVRHGVRQRRGAGRIDVRARREGRHLWLEVQDDGPGLPQDAVAAFQNGIGVSTTRARLQELFGADFRFEFHRLPQGLAVLVVFPWQTVTDSPRGERDHDEDAEVPDRRRRTAGERAPGQVAPG